MKQCNQYLRELYLDYFNNYLTVEKFAEHHALNIHDVEAILAIGESMHEEYVKLHRGEPNVYPLY